MATDGTSSPSLTNVTFSGNSADYGGAMYNDGLNGASSPSLSNVILWGNTAVISGSQMYNSDASVTITTSLVQGGHHRSGVLQRVAAPSPMAAAISTTTRTSCVTRPWSGWGLGRRG